MASPQPSGENQQDVLLISDASGNLYLIRRETLEGGRVGDEYRQQIQDLLQNNDVSGYRGGELRLSPGSQYQVVSTFNIGLVQPGGRQISDALRLL